MMDLPLRAVFNQKPLVGVPDEKNRPFFRMKTIDQRIDVS